MTYRRYFNIFLLVALAIIVLAMAAAFAVSDSMVPKLIELGMRKEQAEMAIDIAPIFVVMALWTVARRWVPRPTRIRR